MMNLREKKKCVFAVMVLVLCLQLSNVSTAAAFDAESFWDSVKEVASDGLETIKEKAPVIWGEAKEKAPVIWDAAKEKGSELADTAQGKLSEAGQQISDYRADQEQQVWDWFNHMTNQTNQASEPSQNTSEPEAQTTTDATKLTQPIPEGNQIDPTGDVPDVYYYNPEDTEDGTPNSAESEISTLTPGTYGAGDVIISVHGDRLPSDGDRFQILPEGVYSIGNTIIRYGNATPVAGDPVSEETEKSGFMAKIWTWICQLPDNAVIVAIVAFALLLGILIVSLIARSASNGPRKTRKRKLKEPRQHRQGVKAAKKDQPKGSKYGLGTLYDGDTDFRSDFTSSHRQYDRNNDPFA